MAIGIQGVRLSKLSLDLNDKTGTYKPGGEYEILSTTGKTLAKQTIGGYGGIEVPASIETVRLLNAFCQSYAKDVRTMIGLDEVEAAPVGTAA